MTTLKVESISKQYKRRTVVQDVSMHVQAGEIVGLLGPNGAGKTTSFYMIVGLVPCDSGEILLDNHRITAYPLHVRAKMGIGYLPQEASVFRKLTVEENVLGILQALPGLSKAECQARLEALLQELHITHIRNNTGMSLSGGERRRVEIARALATSPRFMLLDEPFAGVDPISVIEITKLINHLKEKGIGVLITDHNVRETLSICGRAYIMNGGVVIAEGTPRRILEHEVVRQVYLGEDFKL